MYYPDNIYVKLHISIGAALGGFDPGQSVPICNIENMVGSGSLGTSFPLFLLQPMA